jgi:cobalt/nickel transport system permease protein
MLRDLAAGIARDVAESDVSSASDSPIHRLHPLAATVTTLAFVMAVVSVPTNDPGRLLPFLVFPVVAASAGGLPVRSLFRRIGAALPLALLVALPALLLDRRIETFRGSFPVTHGMVVFGSVGLRGALTIAAALVLTGTTGIGGALWALRRLGLPRVLGAQILLTWRYLGVLANEADRMLRARDLRGLGGGRDFRTWGALVGTLLLRAVARAERVHGAMELRGFEGDFYPQRLEPAAVADLSWTILWIAAFVVFRAFNLPMLVDRVLAAVLS